MKKVLSFSVLALFLLNGMAFAMDRSSAEYEKMKEYKKSQREKKASPSAASSQEKGFWQKEAERSGFAGTAAMLGNGIANVVPLDKPNSRKTQ